MKSKIHILALGALLCSNVVACPLHKLAGRTLMYTGSQFVKSLAAPLLTPFHMTLDLDKALKVLDKNSPEAGRREVLGAAGWAIGTRLLKDIPAFMAYGLYLWANPILDDAHYEQDEYQEEIDAFQDPTPDGLRIFANVMHPTEEKDHYEANKVAFNQLKEKDPNWIYIEGESLSDAMTKAQARSEADQKPIAYLKLNEHGNVGSFGGTGIETVSRWNDGRAFVYRPRSKDHEFEKLNPETFAKGARIEFHSCLVGRGEEGKEFVETFGKVFLKKGGVVYAPRLSIHDSVMSKASSSNGAAYQMIGKVLPGMPLGFNLYRQFSDVDPELTLSQRMNLKDHRLLRVEIKP